MLPAVLPFPDISPELFSIDLGGFAFALRWYALSYIAGIVIGWRLVLATLRRERLWPGGRAPMDAATLEELLTWVILGVILGGRLGFVLFYQPGFYLANPSQILMIWQGGMSFHGGFLGVVAAVIVFTWRRGIPLAGVADVLCMATPPGLLLGRLANFVNAELWGRPSTLPWAVIFPGDAAQSCANVAGDLCARHPSQLYEALLEGLVLGAVLLWAAWRRGALKRPGQVAGMFFAGYGLARFAVEFARQPDAQFAAADNPLGHVALGLTMGQILSLPMIAVGLYVIWRARRQAPARAA